MSAEGTGARKKTTKGYYVQSRYKQAAETFSSECTYRKEKSPNDLTQYRGSPRKAEKEVMMQSTANWKSNNIRKRGLTSSTPAIGLRAVLPSIDASVITDATGFLSLPKEHKRPFLSANDTVASRIYQKSKSTLDQTTKGLTLVMPSRRPSSEANSSTNATCQTEVNIAYAEYLQAKLLEINAKKALEMRSKDSSKKFHQVWCLMQQLMDKNAAICKELNEVLYFISLHKHLCKQEEMLLPVLEMLPLLGKQYKTIEKAVTIVQHKLEIRGIALPDGGSKGEIIELLKQIVTLIRSLKSVYDSDEIISAASIADKFTKQGKLVSEEIERGAKLLSEANHLLLSEMSLKLV